jgi:hypothetical protein
MTRYKVKLVSQTNAAIMIFLLLGGFMALRVFLLPPEITGGTAIVLVVVLFLVAYTLWQFGVTGRAEWAIDDVGFTVTWTKRFLLSGVKDLEVKWSEIAKVSRGFDPKYDIVKIELIDGRKFRFIHDTITSRDDFLKVRSILEARVSGNAIPGRQRKGRTT